MRTSDPPRCPACGGVVERTHAEATRTMAPAFAYSLDDLYVVQVTVSVLACTACEWVVDTVHAHLHQQ